MGHPVFISYARRASRARAEALHHALGGKEGLAFLDTSGIEPGEKFPAELADALLGSRVVVVFASKDYFRRWYCLWELEAVLGPFLALGPAATKEQKEAALAPIVVALPSRGNVLPELRSLPPALQERHWPTEEEVEQVVALVRAKLAGVPTTLQERLAAVGPSGAALRTRLLEESALPPPGNLAALRVSPRSLPQSLGASFMGRADELWRIHYTLTVLRDLRGEGAAGASLTGALHGAGGFGKTRLALEYLYRFGPSQHPGGLFWVNADVSPERLEEQFHGILQTLRPDVPELLAFRESRRNAAREMAEALEAVAARQRVLYVVDNVPEPGPDEHPKSLETWCPAIGKVALLATSRARLDLGTEGVHALPVSALARDAAIALLTDGVERGRVDEAGWARISEWVGYLPLALELLNRTLKAGGLEAEELLSHAEGQGPTRVLDAQVKLLERHVPRGALRGVTEAFSISYKRLSRAEQRAARLLAQLAPEPIPVELLEALGPKVVPHEVRATLRSRHVVTAVEAAGPVLMFGAMHRVLADYLRGQARSSVTELKQVCQGLLVLMTPAACREPKAWPLLAACLPHAELVLERLMDGSRPRPRERGQGEPPELRLGTVVGRYLEVRGLLRQARGLEERMVEHALRLLGPEHPVTSTAMSDLAVILKAQGELDGARALQERVLEVRRRVLGNEHADTLVAMNNLALTLQAQGDLKGARAVQERVLEVSRRALGGEHPQTLFAMNNLALTLQVQGELDGARALQERALEVLRRVPGEAHPDTLRAMGNLAGTLRIQGAWEEAQVLQERVLELSRQVLGEEHSDTLLAMHNLALTLHVRGAWAGARALQEQVLEVRRRVSGEKHPDTRLAMGTLAMTLFRLGDLAGARALQERALEVTLRLVGEAHPHTLLAMGNLAMTLYQQGDLEGARARQERVLELSRRVLGAEHPDSLMAMNNLAMMLQARGDLEEASALQERALEVSRRVLGEEHPHTLLAMGNQATVLHEQGDLEGARVQQERVLEVLCRVLGEEHPDTLLAMSNLATILYQQGGLEGARALEERVLESRRRMLGEQHPDTLTAMDNLAATLRKQGEHERAEVLEEQARELRQRTR